MESGEYTISQLRSFAVTARKDAVINPVRVLPEAVTQTASELLQEKPPADVIQYVNGAFYYYRAAIFRDPLVPVTEVNGAYEWLEPADFSWDDVDTVTEKGQWVKNFSNIKPGVATLAYYEEAIKELAGIGTPKPQTVLRRYKAGEKEVAFLEDTALFRVTPEKIGFLGSQFSWQLKALDTFSSGLTYLQCYSAEGGVEDNALKVYVSTILKRTSEPFAEQVLILL